MGVKDQYLPFFDTPVVDVRDYKPSHWHRLSPEDQEKWVDEVFDFYRNQYGFPYFRVPDEKVYKTLWKLRNRTPKMEDDLILWDPLGSTLCAHFFPHIWTVSFRNKKTAMDGFLNDKILRQAIELSFKIKPSVGPSDLIGAFVLGTSSSIGVVSRFKPTAAKAVWDRYAPEKGVCYDYACGWGGRLMGCLASKKQLKYVGVDPEPRTHACLLALNEHIQHEYDEPNRALIRMVGSEDFCPEAMHGRVDVAFSSPPYFNMERYSDDPTQSHIKFPTVDGWLDGFLLKTFENIRALLKPGGVLALNLLDYDAKALSLGALERIRSLGFEEVETLRIQMAQRRGNGQDTSRAFKTEPVYVFSRPK